MFLFMFIWELVQRLKASGNNNVPIGSIVVPFGTSLQDSKYEPQKGTTVEPQYTNDL